MPLVFFWIIAALELAGTPLTATCQMQAQLSAGVLESVALDCPTTVPDAAALQTRADQIAARVPTPLVLAELGSLNQTSPMFELTEAGWQLKDAALLIRGRAQYPALEAHVAINVRCDLAVQLNQTGRALSHQAVCEGREHRTEASIDTVMFEPAVREAIEKSVWFAPVVSDRQCAVFDLWFARQSWRPDWMAAPVENAPRC